MTDDVTGPISGQCLCGGCRYRSAGPVMNVRACHCRRCQRATGSAFYARVMVTMGSLTIDGPVAWYDGDTGIRRGFCPGCGSTMYSERASAGTIGLTIGTIDHPDRYPPTDHIRTESKQAWLVLADGLPQFRQGPPAI